jgi:hypothetical protein
MRATESRISASSMFALAAPTKWLTCAETLLRVSERTSSNVRSCVGHPGSVEATGRAVL